MTLAEQTEDKKGLEESIQFAKKFLEDLLSFFGLNTDVYATAEDEIIELHVPSTHLNGFLIGQHGDTIRAIQFMVGAALRSNDFAYIRAHVDVAEYKKQRAERLAKRAEEWMQQVRETEEPMHLKPMGAAERRIVHKVADEAGLITESEGEGRERHVVIKPKESTKSIKNS